MHLLLIVLTPWLAGGALLLALVAGDAVGRALARLIR